MKSWIRKLWAGIVMVAFLFVNTCAMADVSPKTEVMNSWDLVYSNVVLNRVNGTLMVYDQIKGHYTLMAPDGTKLTSEPYISMQWLKEMFTVKAEEGVNKTGLIDKTGKLVIPMQYQRVTELSERWQIADVYEKGNLFNNEFKASDGNYYKYGYSDVYFDGKLVGTLKTQGYGMACGAYLYIDNTYYDGQMTPSTYVRSGSGDTEYDVTDHGTFHMFTGQQVGVPTCTLTSEDVKNDIVFVGNSIVDLQGNLLGTIEKEYDDVYCFRDGYAQVELNGKVGLIDPTGKEVIPCEYDELSGFEYFVSGYAIAIKDDKVGYLNQEGEVAVEFKYGRNEVINYNFSPMTWKYNEDQSITVISAAVGEIPQTFKTVNMTSEGCPLFSAVLPNGYAGVYDMYGNEIISPNENYTNVYCFNISDDGSVIQADKNYGAGTTIYQMSDAYGLQSKDKAEKPVTQPAAEFQPEVQPVQTANSTEWRCACGSINNGKFCPECGTVRPKEFKCANCGYVPPADSAPKFCSECGTAY